MDGWDGYMEEYVFFLSAVLDHSLKLIPAHGWLNGRMNECMDG